MRSEVSPAARITAAPEIGGTGPVCEEEMIAVDQLTALDNEV